MSLIFDQLSAAILEGAKAHPKGVATPSKDAALLEAWQKTLTGDLADAEARLMEGGRLPTDPAALDLLARLAAHGGRQAQAKAHWQAALRQAPGFALAQTALAGLEPPRQIWRLTLWAVALAALALAGGLSVWGGYAMITGFRDRQRVETLAANRPTPSLQPFFHDDTDQLAREIAFPQLAVMGFTIRTNAGAPLILFDHPPFLYQDILTAAAREEIEVLAKAIGEYTATCWILIEGHATANPPRAGSPRKDAYALGLQRALAVANILRTVHGIPAQAILISSVGSGTPPYPGHAAAALEDYGTVVLRLIPRTGEQQQSAPRPRLTQGVNRYTR